jgi:hypothetical protein
MIFMKNLVGMYRRMGNLDLALLSRREVVERSWHMLGDRHPTTLKYISRLIVDDDPAVHAGRAHRGSRATRG